MKANKIFMIVFLWGLMVTVVSVPAIAQQETSSKKYRGIVAFQPLIFTINGLRLDYDLAITQNHWIQAGPVLFFNESQNENTGNYLWDSKFLKHNGAGLHLSHRYFPGQGFGQTPVYISYGLMYQHHNIQYLESTSSGDFRRFTAIDRAGVDITIGLVAIAGEILLVDLFTGLGIRVTQNTSDAEKPKLYNDGYIFPGYKGNILLIGMRIGFIH
jgi:hypothetical protein